MRTFQVINTIKSTARTITTSDNLGNSISTTICSAAFIPNTPHSMDECVVPTQENKNMQYPDIYEEDPHCTARRHLISRATSARNNHLNSLEKHFYIQDTDTLNWSGEDFIKAIKDGMYMFKDEKKAKEKGFFNIYDLYRIIRFRDPSKPENLEGFKESRDKVTAAFESVIDIIVVEEPVKARKEVDKFRETIFH